VGRCVVGCEQCSLTINSTCFGHHYAHLQENKGPVTAYGVLLWFCWMWLVAVLQINYRGHLISSSFARTLLQRLYGLGHVCSTVSCVERETTNKMQQSDVYYELLSQHVSGIIMPIFRRTKTLLLQQSDVYYQLLSQHVSGIIVPIFRRTKTVLLQKSDVYYHLLSQHVSDIIMPIFRRTKTVCYCIRCTALFLLDVVVSGFGGAAL
jgi:hypothetical protein